ncbi:SpaH/EbpB family LPXTG-anchored major pilin [Vagococcus bubulae]|uniref:Uncharacterized protein n=1 Tax=Vagococcus bubulae TaxID=1977868 RepID=A0A429ZC02_9ENTE|nr:SpaH/EbpB family LPXTG-anchored major pilin [Vagococcus bubulae]RST91206.1 hypothetical protein CBF36_10305 [Vagococcus bubulae]
MKNRIKTLIIGLLAWAMVVITGAHPVIAAELSDNVQANVTLHKRVFNMGEKPEENSQLNTGEVNVDFGGEPLSNVTFTMYNITDIYYEKMKKMTGDISVSQKAVIEDIQNSVNSLDLANKDGIDKITSEDGQAIFEKLNTKTNGKDSVYLFLETKTPFKPNITTVSSPIVLAFPIYKASNSDEINKDIHIYPKNEQAENSKKLANIDSFSNKLILNGQEYRNVTTGDMFNYELTLFIPTNIQHDDTTGYVVEDKPTEGLAYSGNLKVGDLKEHEDYTLKTDGGGFSIEFNLDSQNVKKLAGKKLIVTYDMKLTKDINPDEAQNNEAFIIYNPGKEDTVKTKIPSPPGIATGGKKFKKIDAHSGTLLKGAEFIVKQEDKFAKFEEHEVNKGVYIFTRWVNSKEEATRLTSQDNGEFAVKGLLDGEYQLEETKAPSSKYVKLPKDILFLVSHGQYEKEEVQSIKNTPKGLLPSTGGKGIIMFLVLGSLMMFTAIIWSKKYKKQINI